MTSKFQLPAKIDAAYVQQLSPQEQRQLAFHLKKALRAGQARVTDDEPQVTFGNSTTEFDLPVFVNAPDPREFPKPMAVAVRRAVLEMSRG